MVRTYKLIPPVLALLRYKYALCASFGKGCLYLYVAMYVVLLSTSYLYDFFIVLHSVLGTICDLYIREPLANCR